jgi:hypothetical protein
MPRFMVVRMDHLRDMAGVWQSQVVVPKALISTIGKSNFIRTTGIRNTGPASRKQAAASPVHLAFVADAKTEIANARARLAGSKIELPGRFVELSTTNY